MESWCEAGGPLGIRRFPKDLGIFPAYTDECPDNPEHLESFQDGAELRGAAAEADDETAEELAAMVQKKCLVVSASFEDLKRRLKEAPIVSDLIVITKMSGGKKKKRMVVHFKRSGTSQSSNKSQRVL